MTCIALISAMCFTFCTDPSSISQSSEQCRSFAVHWFCSGIIVCWLGFDGEVPWFSIGRTSKKTCWADTRSLVYLSHHRGIYTCIVLGHSSVQYTFSHARLIQCERNVTVVLVRSIKGKHIHTLVFHTFPVSEFTPLLFILHLFFLREEDHRLPFICKKRMAYLCFLSPASQHNLYEACNHSLRSCSRNDSWLRGVITVHPLITWY